jgi:hypothetical protein
MKDVVLWSLWYGILVTLPPILTRLLIKNSMVRITARTRQPSSVRRK